MQSRTFCSRDLSDTICAARSRVFALKSCTKGYSEENMCCCKAAVQQAQMTQRCLVFGVRRGVQQGDHHGSPTGASGGRWWGCCAARAVAEPG